LNSRKSVINALWCERILYGGYSVYLFLQTIVDSDLILCIFLISWSKADKLHCQTVLGIRL